MVARKDRMSIGNLVKRLTTRILLWVQAWLNRHLGSPGSSRDAVGAVGTPETSLQVTLERLRRLQPEFRTVVDIGASDGSWTQAFMQVFPDAEYLMFECDERQREPIEKFSADHPNVHLKFAAASAQEGELFLIAPTLYSGAVHDNKWDDSMLSVSAATIDGEIARLQLPPPYFVKLDTHGFEIPILEGAAGIFDQIEFLMIEVYNFKVHPQSLHFSEMCSYLDQRGFRPMFLCDPLYRARDGALWQFDLIFARKERKEFEFGGWG